MISEERVWDMWMYRDNIHGGDLKLQLLDLARAMEAEISAPLEARIKELEQEVAKLKTVPMKYRRMAFSAELQTENEKLRAESAVLVLQNKQMREVIEDAQGNINTERGFCDEVEKSIDEALALPDLSTSITQ